MAKAIDLANQLIEYLNSEKINPLDCWPLLEQLNAELDRLLGPPKEFPNCYPRLLARKITDLGATLWMLDFSVPDIDLAIEFRGTRNEVKEDDLNELRLNLLVAVKGWKRKIPTPKIEIRVTCVWNNKRVHFRREAPQLAPGACWMIGMYFWDDDGNDGLDIASISVEPDGAVTLWADDLISDNDCTDEDLRGWIENGWQVA